MTAQVGPTVFTVANPFNHFYEATATKGKTCKTVLERHTSGLKQTRWS